jgi:hypothetical protein
MGHGADATDYGSFSQEEGRIADQTALTLSEGVLLMQGTLARVGSLSPNLDCLVLHDVFGNMETT